MFGAQVLMFDKLDGSSEEGSKKKSDLYVSF